MPINNDEDITVNFYEHDGDLHPLLNGKHWLVSDGDHFKIRAIMHAHQAAKAQIETMQAQRERDFRDICMLIGLIADKNTINENHNKTIANLRIVNAALADSQSQLKSVEVGRLSSTYRIDKKS